MYLEKLVVQGFKSFANKNTLVFPGMISKSKRGLTAVVGPNGSGKSNIADSVRWALGEQSMKTLRGKKSEDVIFSGSDKKGKLGMAEVSLFLNNEDSVEKNKIEMSEICLTRRLYRDGESEYLINNARVRLADVQMLLAKANFGQKTYSVIGQGMVEGFLNTSLTERKEFFDEATGVKQFQIKRDDSLNKLEGSYENLNQVNMLLSEIEPRLKSLTRQVAKLEKREAIEKELKVVEIEHYSRLWNEINARFNEHNQIFLNLEKEKIEKEKKLEKLNEEFEKLSLSGRENGEIFDLKSKLMIVQKDKDVIVKQIARIDAEIEIKLESRGQFDVSWLKNKQEELEQKTKKLKQELDGIRVNLQNEKNGMEKLSGEKKNLEIKFENLNRQLLEFKKKNKNVNGAELSEELKRVLESIVNIENENDLKKIKEAINEIKNKFRATIEKLNLSFDDEIEKLENEILLLARERENLNARINEFNLALNSSREKLNFFEAEEKRSQAELSDISAKLVRSGTKADTESLDKEKKELKIKLDKIEEEINDIDKKLNEFGSKEEDEKLKMLSMQKNINALQMEINLLNGKMNEAKINSTRFETRLEDLESEIRVNLGGLKEIKEHTPNADFNTHDAEEKIRNLKHQLELIGGIDPETSKEYEETKERFEFLSGQVEDLNKTVDSLESIIKELDEKIKEQFDKEFKIIASKFEEYFKILFNGGTAQIIKVIEEDLNKEEKSETENTPQNLNERRIKFLKKHNATGLAGIEIQATPPGKKIKSISMLSGGERALTAIALICAIISANPSPFVVLDEVDAALDEANSERLAKILDDLSHKTQFIVITHNRASMRRASILYGVTMEESGISKLLSIKLDDSKSVD